MKKTPSGHESVAVRIVSVSRGRGFGNAGAHNRAQQKIALRTGVLGLGERFGILRLYPKNIVVVSLRAPPSLRSAQAPGRSNPPFYWQETASAG